MIDQSGDRGSPAASAEIDRLLSEMGASARQAAPGPTARLVERVLGDAAAVAAERAVTDPLAAPAGAGVAECLPAAHGWAGRIAGPRLAAAVLMLSLLAGFGTGYALGPASRVAEPVYASDPGWDYVDEDIVVATLF